MSFLKFQSPDEATSRQFVAASTRNRSAMPWSSSWSMAKTGMPPVSHLQSGLKTGSFILAAVDLRTGIFILVAIDLKTDILFWKL